MSLFRKEVIQPQVPLRLPCYDFSASHRPLPSAHCFPCGFESTTSGAIPTPITVTGGVYKARERIHRGMLIRDY